MKPNTLTTIGKLTPGAVFLYKGILYIKTNYKGVSIHKNRYDCIGHEILSNGEKRPGGKRCRLRENEEIIFITNKTPKHGSTKDLH